MCQSKNRPNDHILVLNIVSPVNHILHTAHLSLALEQICSCCPQLSLLIFRHPNVMLSKQSSFSLQRALVSKQQLGRRWYKLVANGFHADRIQLGRVDHLEDTIVERCGICPPRRFDWGLHYAVEISHRVCLGIHGLGNRLFLDNGVGMTINRGVNTDSENVLVVLCKNSWVDNVSVLADLSWIDVDAGYNAGSTNFYVKLAREIELIGKDILVVCKSEDKLHGELTVASDDCTVGAPICVLPSDAVILFVETYDIWLNFHLAVFADCHGIEVLRQKRLVSRALSNRGDGLIYLDSS
jgi:hypothetical protein